MSRSNKRTSDLSQASPSAPLDIDKSVLKIFVKFFVAAEAQKDADMDTFPNNNRIYGDAVREVKAEFTRLLEGLKDDKYTIWVTEPVDTIAVPLGVIDELIKDLHANQTQ